MKKWELESPGKKGILKALSYCLHTREMCVIIPTTMVIREENRENEEKEKRKKGKKREKRRRKRKKNRKEKEKKEKKKEKKIFVVSTVTS